MERGVRLKREDVEERWKEMEPKRGTNCSFCVCVKYGLCALYNKAEKNVRSDGITDFLFLK